MECVGVACGGCGNHRDAATLYFCAECHALRCSHPSCTAESVEAMYCPACFCRFGTFESIEHRHRCSKCFTCPKCQVALTTTSEVVLGSDEPQCFFVCGYCCWDSVDAGLVAGTLEELLKMGRTREDATPTNVLLHSLLSGDTPAAGTTDLPLASPPPAVSDLGRLPSARDRLRPGSDAAPSRRELLVVCERRCRACVDAGLTGILVKPDPIAFTHNAPAARTRWFVKHTAAAVVLPRLRAAADGDAVLIEVANTVDEDVEAVVGDVAFTLPGFDETLPQDAALRQFLDAAPRGGGLGVVATSAHKVVVRVGMGAAAPPLPMTLKYPAAVLQGVGKASAAAVAAGYTLTTSLRCWGGEEGPVPGLVVRPVAPQ